MFDRLPTVSESQTYRCTSLSGATVNLWHQGKFFKEIPEIFSKVTQALSGSCLFQPTILAR